jgi:hypothetical protein
MHLPEFYPRQIAAYFSLLKATTLLGIAIGTYVLSGLHVILVHITGCIDLPLCGKISESIVA